jgi:hypothetical protein
MAAFRYYQPLTVGAGQELEKQLNELESGTERLRCQSGPKHRRTTRRYEPKGFDLRGELYRIFGVDLTNVPVPGEKISGGKVLYTKSRRVRSRVATAFERAPSLCITRRTTSASSSAASLASRASHKPLLQRRIG